MSAITLELNVARSLASVAQVPVFPLGGGQDDWPNLIATLNANAGKAAVIMQPGAWTCATPCLDITSGAWLVASPGVVITSTMSPSGGIRIPFRTDPQLQQNTTTATLAAAPARGATSLSVNFTGGAVLNVGDHFVMFAQGAYYRSQVFRVTAVTGSSNPRTISLDDTIEFAFAISDPIYLADVASDIRLEGNGATLTGTGDIGFSIGTAQRCTVSGWRITAAGGSFTSGGISIDTARLYGAGRDNTVRDVIVEGVGVTSLGIQFQSQIRPRLEGARVYGCGAGGVVSYSCVGSRVFDVDSGGNTGYGMYFGGNSTAEEGCRQVTAANIRLHDNAGIAGLGIVGGDSLAFADVDSSRNTGSGVILSPYNSLGPADVTFAGLTTNTNASANGGVFATGATENLKISNVTSSNNTGPGIQVTAGDAQLANVSTFSNGSVGIQNGGAVLSVAGWRSDDDVGGPFNLTGGITKISGGHVRNVALSGSWYGLVTNATVFLTNYVAEYVAGTGTKILAVLTGASTELYLNNIKTIGTLAYGVSSQSGVATKTFRGVSVNLASCTTPFHLDSSSLANFGQFTATGTTAVTVNGCFAAQSSITISFNTLGGTQGAAPTLSSKSANSFQVKATALDTSTYDWSAV